MNFNTILSSIYYGNSSKEMTIINDYSFCPGCGIDLSQFNHDSSCPYSWSKKKKNEADKKRCYHYYVNSIKARYNAHIKTIDAK